MSTFGGPGGGQKVGRPTPYVAPDPCLHPSGTGSISNIVVLIVRLLISDCLNRPERGSFPLDHDGMFLLLLHGRIIDTAYNESRPSH